ncbi:MAG: alanine racemase, partial [Deltaproteobacteria bacterium]|nr:alanine racemase [Deltaproteobacteria bacterium]
EVPEKRAVSYGRTFITKRKSRLAVIAVGYADGYSRALSNKGEVLIKGKRAPIVGRVCMDLTIIDITNIADVKEEDEVVLIGEGLNGNIITVDEVAEKIGTISYEVFCNISKRVKRVYIDSSNFGEIIK